MIETDARAVYSAQARLEGASVVCVRARAGGLARTRAKMPSDEPLPSIMPAEEKELARVHKLLCDYHSKRKVLRELRPKQERVASLRSKLDDEDGGDLSLIHI